MAEYITSSNSSAEVLKAKGMEVITRCRDCRYGTPSVRDGFIVCELFSALGSGKYGYEVEPCGQCYWGEPRE